MCLYRRGCSWNVTATLKENKFRFEYSHLESEYRRDLTTLEVSEGVSAKTRGVSTASVDVNIDVYHIGEASTNMQAV